MPVVYHEIELLEVLSALKRKGYGQVQSRRYGLALNKWTGKRYQSGGEIRETIGGISHEQLRHILRHAESAEQAATMIESAVLGEDLGITERKALPEPSTMSPEVIDRMVTNRVANEVAKCIAPVQEQMFAMLREMKEAMNRVQLAPQPKRLGRPPGSKNKPKTPPPPDGDVTYKDLKGPRSSDVADDAV